MKDIKECQDEFRKIIKVLRESGVKSIAPDYGSNAVTMGFEGYSVSFWYHEHPPISDKSERIRITFNVDVAPDA